MNAGFSNAAVLEVVAQVGCTTPRQPHAQRPRCPARRRLRAAGVGQGRRLPPDRGPRSPGPGSAARCAPAAPKGHRPDPRDRDRGEPRDHLGHQASRVVECGGAVRSADLPVVAVRARDPAKAPVDALWRRGGSLARRPARGWKSRRAATRPRRPVRSSFQVRSWLASVPASRLVVSRRQPSHHQLQTGCNRYRPCSAGR
jgi:hypothetical protein